MPCLNTSRPGFDLGGIKITLKFPKKKPVKISTLDRKLWKLFSVYIRKRDRTHGEYAPCISCGKMHLWKDLDAGHFINRRHKTVKYHEKNVSAQCRVCNRFEEGNQFAYSKGLIKKYGEGVIKELEVAKQSKVTITKMWYLGMIQLIKEKLKEQD